MISLKNLCIKCDVTRRAIQGYEKYRLLEPSSKTNRGYLLYEDSCIERVNQIKMFQKFGFKVREIEMYIDAKPEILKEVLILKEKELQGKKEDLEETIQQLEHLIHQL
ncbi:MAG: MerR family transcriptional regulator [Bacillota bacterium]|nr:MerR family transcriptional regulator [Bacillota bacterium]